MRRWAVVLVLGLAACSSSSPSSSAPQDTETKFLLYVRGNVPGMMDVPASSLIAVAHQACATLEAGGTQADIVHDIEDSTYLTGLSPEDIGSVAGAGIAAYCPDQQSKLDPNAVDTSS